MADPSLRSPLSRRIGGKSGKGNMGLRQRIATRAILLHGLTGVAALAALIVLLTGDFGQAIGGCLACAGLLAASRCMARGLQSEFEFQSRRIAQAPRPLKTTAHLLVVLAVFVLAWVSAQEPLAMSALFAGLAGIGSYLAYGGDPRHDKDVDAGLAQRAGIDTSLVIETLNEAEIKLATIEADAREIVCRELVERLGRIVASGRRILDQIEKDPGDVRRARRFLVTYLDGTRDVVSKYRAQQHDVAQTPLGDNFRHVLETVEKVFGEQETVLKRNESLDLEVQIQVLQTQMEREGVV